jgi:hypothetical protein
VTQQELNRLKISCFLKDQRCLGPAERMRAIEAWIKADQYEPPRQQSCVLPRGQMPCLAAPREEIWIRGSTPLREIVVDRLSGLLRDLEANRPSCFALSDGGSIDGTTMGCHISDPQSYQVAHTNFAVDG